MSLPYQISRRLFESSKNPLVWTGRPVKAGSGRKQYAWPRTDSAAEIMAATPAQGVRCRPRRFVLACFAIAAAAPPPMPWQMRQTLCVRTSPLVVVTVRPYLAAAPAESPGLEERVCSMLLWRRRARSGFSTNDSKNFTGSGCPASQV